MNRHLMEVDRIIEEVDRITEEVDRITEDNSKNDSVWQTNKFLRLNSIIVQEGLLRGIWPI